MFIFSDCFTQDEATFTLDELEKLTKALDLSVNDLQEVIDCCEFVIHQVRDEKTNCRCLPDVVDMVL
jgi:hypothetical protein